MLEIITCKRVYSGKGVGLKVALSLAWTLIHIISLGLVF